MKYCVKFENVNNANNYKILNVPFLCSINAPSQQNVQNLHTSKHGKYIKIDNNVASTIAGPLQFKSNGQTTISLARYNHTPDIDYSYDKISWISWDENNYQTLNLNNGQVIWFKGNNRSGFSSSSPIYSKFVFGGTGTISAGGNVMSLIDNGTCTETSIPNNYCFYRLFFGCTSLTSAPELPATTLASSCYSYMFSGCTSLTSAPELPATTLANYCYQSMFYNCTSLTSAPKLPATTLASSCYSYMFSGCTSLTSALELPATTLASSCYWGMFYNCTSLTSTPALPATTLASSCYSYMFFGCTSLTSAPELPATTLADSCYQYMFQSCISLTSAPVLPATTLADSCYWSMFQNCYSLHKALYYSSDFPLLNNRDFLNYFIGWELWVDGVFVGIIEDEPQPYYI